MIAVAVAAVMIVGPVLATWMVQRSLPRPRRPIPVRLGMVTVRWIVDTRPFDEAMRRVGASMDRLSMSSGHTAESMSRWAEAYRALPKD